MLKSNKRIALIFTFIFMSIVHGNTQDCKLSIEGFVYDETTQLPLSYVNVVIQENSKGNSSDDSGQFKIDGLCASHYHINISHIGCETQTLHIDLVSDTLLYIFLDHTEAAIGTVVVTGKVDKSNGQARTSVNRKTLEDNTEKNLSGILENETGVHLIKNGGTISKPVVQGLYGNRLTVLNNGIIQSGQQWGNDHGPEIDPYSADEISVLKGASAIQYGGGNLGSVILVEPKRISRDPHLHGQINYTHETNGRGNILNTRFGKYSPFVAWRLSGTLKKYGDSKTADYFLNNTGVTEANLSLQLEKTWNKVFFLDLYGSTFNTTLGILRGSQIGNVPQLNEALEREEPFFTEPDLSYDIDPPKQQVSHHLLKLKSKYFLNDNQIFEAVLAAQVNDRKEFDIRRGERSDIPTLSLLQQTVNAELLYSHTFENEWKIKLGNQNIFTNNTNNPETDVLPLIPDYLSWRLGAFGTASKQFERLFFNLGLRYDYEYQDVPTILNTVPKEILRFENVYNNLSGILTSKYNLTKEQTLSVNLGYAIRNPGINELYSMGLHQGVSGIEEGTPDLVSEKAIKLTAQYKWVPSTYFSLDALAYFQNFNDYIYLNPQDELRLTIRGVFPVFQYEQTDAQIYGLDISTQFTVRNSLLGTLKYSYLKGNDTRNDVPLIFMPPNRIFGSLTYQAQGVITLGKKMRMEETEFELNNRYVFEQKNILAAQDFVEPPAAYNLLGFKISTNLITQKYKVRLFMKADNLLNTQYRDYLNRQRYFADDLGLSVILGLNFKF